MVICIQDSLLTSNADGENMQQMHSNQVIMNMIPFFIELLENTDETILIKKLLNNALQKNQMNVKFIESLITIHMKIYNIIMQLQVEIVQIQDVIKLYINTIQKAISLKNEKDCVKLRDNQDVLQVLWELLFLEKDQLQWDSNEDMTSLKNYHLTLTGMVNLQTYIKMVNLFKISLLLLHAHDSQE